MSAARLAELIRAARGGPEPVLARVADELAGLGFQRRDPGAAALFTRGAPRFVLSGHVDVVPVGAGWTRDPFGGELAEGRVWGRGACDMLGSVACFVEAAQRTPDAPCGILLTTDEETTMRGAAGALADGLLAGVEGVVVGEPTSMHVGVAEKGVLWLRVDATGVNAHGSMPELGDNAVERIVRVASRIATSGTRSKGEHALLGRATMSVNKVSGGDAVNQVPARASLEIDARFLPGTTQEDVLAPVRAALAPEGGRATLHVLASHAPFETPADGPLARAALDASRTAGVAGARAIGLPYGTEASKFAPAGIPTVILGPGEPGLAHTDHESIRLADLEAGAVAYARLLERWGE